MESEWDTNATVRFWVTGLKPYYGALDVFEMDNIAFDENGGFANRRPRLFKGPVLFVAEHGRVSSVASIAVNHVSRRGFVTTISYDNNLAIPPPPFLVTSDLDTVRLYDGKLRISSSDDDKVPVEDFGADEPIAIGGRDWYGVAIQVGNGPVDFRLMAFGKAAAKGPIVGETLSHLEIGETYGKIERLSL